MGEFRFLLLTDRFDETCGFYGGLLRCAVTNEWDTPRPGRIFALGDGRIEVIDGPAASLGQVALAVEAGDVVALHERLDGAGAAVDGRPTLQPWGHLSFTVHDPNGLPITFFQVVHPE